MSETTPGQAARDLQAKRDYEEFSRWWQSKGYPDGMSLDFSDARDAFASGMRAARALAAQEPPASPELAEVRAADGTAAPELTAAMAENRRYLKALESVFAVLDRQTLTYAERISHARTLIRAAREGK